MAFRAELKKLGACEDAIKWVGNKSCARAWRECPRADWMLWYVGQKVGTPGWPTQTIFGDA